MLITRNLKTNSFFIKNLYYLKNYLLESFMDNEHTYCDFSKNLKKNNVHKIYHDTQYGFPLDSDNELFGRLILEINQAGLSWNTILNKQENFRKAYSNFSIKTIANYNDKARTRLLNDAGIVRNRLKVNAVIHLSLIHI